MSFPYINAYQQFFDSSGSPLVSGTIEFRDPTSNAYINSYPTAVDADAQTNANANPLTLSSDGAAANGLFLEDGVAYKVILKDSAGNTVATHDDVRCPIILPYLQTAAETAAGVTPTNVEYPSGDVRRYGATGDGVTDDSAAIINAHLVGDKVTYPKGDYLFTSATNPDLSNGVELINAEWNSAVQDNILRFDRGGQLIGLQMNHLENTSAATAITTGTSTSPPLSTASISGPVEVLAHWYNDLGQEYGRINRASTWYTGEYIHTTAAAYDAQRVPIQGFYRGDDPQVMDWQCYWLREAGITAVNPFTTDGMDIDTTTWATASDNHHFLYQLFNNVPNFKGLKYCLWQTYDASAQTQWEANIDDIYLVYPNCYTVEHNGKQYPVVYVFEGSSLVTNLGGEAAFQTFCDVMVAKFQAAGYGGMAIFMRHPPAHETVDRDIMEVEHSTLMYGADYGGVGGRLKSASLPSRTVNEAATTYTAMVDSYAPYNTVAEWAIGGSYVLDDIVRYKGWLCISRTTNTGDTDNRPFGSLNGATNWFKWGPVSREIPGCSTARYAISPHPSDGGNTWLAQGTTPALFEKWLRKTVNAAIVNDGPRIVSIYNVAEWAEGGPGLIPNISDGWGYLDAVKNVLTGGVEALPITKKQGAEIVGHYFVVAATEIPCRYSRVHLDENLSRVLTSTPTIEAGVDGQTITLIQTGGNTITLQDDGTLSGSTLFLSANTIALAPYDSIELQYVTGKGWIQTSQVNVL